MASVFDEFLDQTLQDDFKNLDNVYRSLVNVVRRIKTAADEGNLEALRQATVDELAAVPGMNRRAAEQLLEHL